MADKRTKPSNATDKKDPKLNQAQTIQDDEEDDEQNEISQAIGQVVDKILEMGTLTGLEPAQLDKHQGQFENAADISDILKLLVTYIGEMTTSLSAKLDKLNNQIGSKVKTFKMDDVLDVSMLQEIFGALQRFSDDMYKYDRIGDKWDKNYNHLQERLTETDNQVKILEQKKAPLPINIGNNKEDLALVSDERVQEKILQLEEEWNLLGAKAGEIIRGNLKWDFTPHVSFYLCINCGVFLQHGDPDLFDYTKQNDENSNKAFKKLAGCPVLERNRLESIRDRRLKKEAEGESKKVKKKGSKVAD